MRYEVITLPITTAQALAVAPPGPMQLQDSPRSLCAQANFVYGSGGTTVDAYLQTSLDGGATWIDIAQFHFTTASARAVFNLSAATPVTTQYTPTNGTLGANTAKDGILGPMFQVKVATTGTYAGNTNLEIDISASER